jgi:hypothetical protein
MNPITYLLLLALMFKGRPYYSPPYYLPAPFVDTYVQQTPVTRYIVSADQVAGPGVVSTRCVSTVMGKGLTQVVCP